MAKTKSPAPRRAGNTEDVVGFERTIAAAGGDLELLQRLVATADRMIAARRSRRKRKKSTRAH